MTPRSTFATLGVFYLLGIAGGWGLHVYRKPSEEQLYFMQVDTAIRKNLCRRIAADLEAFDKSPQTFKRSSLRVLISESIAVVQTQFQSPGTKGAVKFRGASTEPITAECDKDARRWLRISSVFPELFEEEQAVVERTIPPETTSSVAKSNGSAVAHQDRRVALVIGNSKYSGRPLKNPANDSKDIGQALRNVGFSVIELYDADLPKMRDTVKAFSEQVKNYDVALVYYSGHGIEFAGRNYFIPVDADIKNEDEIPRQGLDATEIVERLGKGNIKTTIFILDACRNAPVFSSIKSAKSGLAIMHGSSGSIVAFSAAPGQIALDGNERNSPYASVLLKQIAVPNKKIEDVLKDTARLVSENTQGRQIPWYNSSLVGDFYFLKKE